MERKLFELRLRRHVRGQEQNTGDRQVESGRSGLATRERNSGEIYSPGYGIRGVVRVTHLLPHQAERYGVLTDRSRRTKSSLRLTSSCAPRDPSIGSTLPPVLWHRHSTLAAGGEARALKLLRG
jgi:hypothetical protein